MSDEAYEQVLHTINAFVRAAVAELRALRSRLTTVERERDEARERGRAEATAAAAAFARNPPGYLGDESPIRKSMQEYAKALERGDHMRHEPNALKRIVDEAISTGAADARKVWGCDDILHHLKAIENHAFEDEDSTIVDHVHDVRALLRKLIDAEAEVVESLNLKHGELYAEENAHEQTRRTLAERDAEVAELRERQRHSSALAEQAVVKMEELRRERDTLQALVDDVWDGEPSIVAAAEARGRAEGRAGAERDVVAFVEKMLDTERRMSPSDKALRSDKLRWINYGASEALRGVVSLIERGEHTADAALAAAPGTPKGGEGT